jgi:dipeptidyl-peptidase-4
MRFVLGLLALFVSVPAVAQVPDQVNDMMHRIFASGEFAGQRFGPARWIENGTAYTTVEPSADLPDAFDIVRYETATGARSVYIGARRLVPTGASEALDFDDYDWSADGNLLLLFTNTQRVWRQNTRGDYWVLDRKTSPTAPLPRSRTTLTRCTSMA